MGEPKSPSKTDQVPSTDDHCDSVQYSATHQDEEVDPSTFKHLNKNNGSNNGSVYAFEFCLRDLRKESWLHRGSRGLLTA